MKNSTVLQLIPPIHRATHKIGLYLERLPLGVSQGEAHALCHLHEVGTCSIGDLHEAFRHKRSTLTSILDRLESKKWVLRKTHPKDRRSFQLSLTSDGKSTAAKVHAHLKELEASVLERVSLGDLKGFNSVIESFRETDFDV